MKFRKWIVFRIIYLIFIQVFSKNIKELAIKELAN